jgi:hypothetical protein
MYLTYPISLHQIITVPYDKVLKLTIPNSTLVKESTTRPTGSTVMQVNHDIVLRPSTGPRTNRQINKRRTRRQIVDPTYHMDDDSTVKTDNISASAIH